MDDGMMDEARIDRETAKDARAAIESAEATAEAVRAAAQEAASIQDGDAQTVMAPTIETAVGTDRVPRISRSGATVDTYDLPLAARVYGADIYDDIYQASLEARQAVQRHVLVRQYAQDMAALAEYETNAEYVKAEREAVAAISGGRKSIKEADWKDISERMESALMPMPSEPEDDQE